MRRLSLARLLPLCALALLAAACGDDDPGAPTPPTGVMPDFLLVDANPNSPTYSQTVSPRSYLDQVSAWYFGHST